MGALGGGNDRRTIPTTCRIHGARGFCDLRVTKVDGDAQTRG